MNEIWKKQFEKYNKLINSSFTEDDFLLTGKINIFGKSMTVSSKYKINKSKNESTEENPLISSSEVSFSHKLFSKLSYTINQKQDKTFINLNYPFLKRGLSNLIFAANTSFNNCEKLTSLPSNFTFNYSNENKNTLAGLNFEENDFVKSFYPQIVSFYFIRKGEFFKKNISGGFYSGFSIPKKYFKYNKFFLGVNGEKLGSVIDVEIVKNKDERKNDKIITFRSDVKLKSKLTVGGESLYKTEEKHLNNKLFFNFNQNFDTVFKGKWEDKDNSVSLNVVQTFRGLIKLGITGKFITIQNEESEKNNILPLFKTKIGVHLDINETLF